VITRGECARKIDNQQLTQLITNGSRRRSGIQDEADGLGELLGIEWLR